MSSRLSPPWCPSSTAVAHRLPAQHHHRRLRFSGLKLSPSKFRCYSNSSTPGGGPGESDSKSVLDAFFLGKALAEAINERVESAVGELLSTVGRLQAEQQKQVQDFQEEVLERAKKAKEMAAREAMEAQGVTPKQSTEIVSATVVDTVSATVVDTVSATVVDTVSTISSNSSDSKTYDVDANPGRNDEDSFVDVPIDD